MAVRFSRIYALAYSTAKVLGRNVMENSAVVPLFPRVYFVMAMRP